MALRDPNTLLPLSSILEKLNAHLPGGAEAVMDAAEKIGAQRREQKSGLVATFRTSCKNLARDFSAGMIIYPGPYGMAGTTPEAITLHEKARREIAQEDLQEDWARTGDSLRLGIRAVMQANNLTAETLALTAAEQDSLTLLLADSEPKPAQPGWLARLIP